MQLTAETRSTAIRSTIRPTSANASSLCGSGDSGRSAMRCIIAAVGPRPSSVPPRAPRRRPMETAARVPSRTATPNRFARRPSSCGGQPTRNHQPLTFARVIDERLARAPVAGRWSEHTLPGSSRGTRGTRPSAHPCCGLARPQARHSPRLLDDPFSSVPIPSISIRTMSPTFKSPSGRAGGGRRRPSAVAITSPARAWTPG